MKKIFYFLINIFVSGIAVAYILPTTSDLNEKSLNTLIKDNKVKELEQLVSVLPPEFRLNFELKHGIKRDGERGHLVENKVSQSSDPDLPRAILWNEKSGFSLSFNGGAAHQTAAHRLDILSFDAVKKHFN